MNTRLLSWRDKIDFFFAGIIWVGFWFGLNIFKYDFKFAATFGAQGGREAVKLDIPLEGFVKT